MRRKKTQRKKKPRQQLAVISIQRHVPRLHSLSCCHHVHSGAGSRSNGVDRYRNNNNAAKWEDARAPVPRLTLMLVFFVSLTPSAQSTCCRRNRRRCKKVGINWPLAPVSMRLDECESVMRTKLKNHSVSPERGCTRNALGCMVSQNVVIKIRLRWKEGKLIKNIYNKENKKYAAEALILALEGSGQHPPRPV